MASPLLLAISGSYWPASLEALGSGYPLNGESVALAEACGKRPLWLGYSHPLDQLQHPALKDPAASLESWCQQARWLLQIHQSSPERCQLLNLSRLSAAAIAELCSLVGAEPAAAGAEQARSDAPAAELDPRLAMLVLQHPDLQNLYADLEGCASLFGRDPEFQLGLPPLRSPAFAQQCLASWDEQRSAAEQLAEAREEAELTLLQLHQVQEELEQIFLNHRRVSQELQHAQGYQQQLGEANGQIQQLRAELQQLRDELQQAQGYQQQLGEAREEAELTLLQLHQVQEELEHYFLEHRKASQELQQQRSELEELQHEARLLFVQSKPRLGLNRSHLSRIHLLMRQTLELNQG